MEKTQICRQCNTFKPTRAHHCSICNRCFLKYDHHCSFLDTCIGFHNYKFFFQFLASNMISVGFFILVISADMITRRNLSSYVLVNYAISLFLFSIEFLYTVVLLVCHMLLISRNETTVESYALESYIKGDHSYVHIFQEGPMKNFMESKDRAVLNPYNLGFRQNWKEVFGEKRLDWLRPTFNSLGDGVSFKTNTEDEEDINKNLL
jgi:palmitoyltransferase ZDHHC2/15/20